VSKLRVGVEVNASGNAEAQLKKNTTAINAMAGAAKAAAAAGAAMAAAGGAALAAAGVQEKAERDLAAALARRGELTAATMQAMLDDASALQSVSTVGDEATIAMQALSVSLGASGDQAREVVRAAADLSAATGIELKQAVRSLTTAYQGQLGSLGEAIPALRGLTKEQLAAGAATEAVAKQFAGAAEEQARTLSGMTLQVKNAFGDMLEDVGFAIQESGPMQLLMANQPAVIAGIKDTAVFWGKAISAMIDAGADFALFLADLSARGIGNVLKGIRWATDVWYDFRDAVTGEDGPRDAVAELSLYIDELGRTSGGIARAAGRMDLLAEAAKATATQAGRVDKLTRTISNETSATVAPAQAVADAAKDAADAEAKAAEAAAKHLDAVRAMSEARGATFAAEGLPPLDVNAALTAGGDALFGDSLAPAFAQGLEMAMPGFGGAIGGALGPVIDTLEKSGVDAADMVADAVDGLADRVLSLFEQMPVFFERIIERLPDMLLSAMRLGMTNMPVMLANPQSIASIIMAAMESVGKMILLPFFAIADAVVGVFGGDLTDTKLGRWILGTDEPGEAATGASFGQRIGSSFRGAGDGLRGFDAAGSLESVRSLGGRATGGPVATAPDTAPGAALRASGGGGGGGGPVWNIVINERENRSGFRADVIRALRDAARLGEVALDVTTGARA
jgi:hypothetical protein